MFGGTQTIAGSHSLAGVELRSATVKTLAPGTTLTVTGLLRLTDGELVGDSLDAHGDIAATSGFDGGSGILRINGSGNQLLTGTATTTVGQLPNLVIDKPSGTLSLAGTIRTQRDWTYLGGLLAPGTSSVVFGGTQTIAGSHSLAGVELRSATRQDPGARHHADRHRPAAADRWRARRGQPGCPRRHRRHQWLRRRQRHPAHQRQRQPAADRHRLHHRRRSCPTWSSTSRAAR